MDKKRSKGGRFLKKSEGERREKASEALGNYHKEKRAEEQQAAEENASVGFAGRRIVDLALLAELLWCDICDKAISLRNIEEEKLCGLASVFCVRCADCLDLKRIPTSKTDDGIGGYPLFTVNLRAALGCLDSGCGHDQFHKCITAMNIPPLSIPTFKRSERRIAGPLKCAVEESCRKAISEEKMLTMSSPVSSAEIDEHHPDDPANKEDVPIVVSFDFQWFMRGNGRQFNSLTGQGNVVGHKTGKVLAVSTRSKCCAMCSRGHPKTDHDCSQNYEGSAKGMEPDTAVQLIVRNPMLKEEGVHVGTLIGDDDSSTISAVRRESSSPVEKWSDRNHSLRGFVSKLYPIMLKGKFPQFTKKVLDYYKKCFQCALDQNKGNAAGLKAALRAIVPHSFGEHSLCGSWCGALTDPNHIFKDLPKNQPLTDIALKEALEAVIVLYVNKAESLAPGASSQLNESFNHMCTTKAPKTRHYGASKALEMRVLTAALQKNEGVTHVLGIAEKANMSPSTVAKKYRTNMEAVRSRRRILQLCTKVKRRRLFQKLKRKQSDAASTRREGFSYHSNIGVSTTLDSASPQTLVEKPQSDQCVPVIIDIETCGLAPSADIIQVAARKGDQLFECHMLPATSISTEVTRITGFSKENGQLFYLNERVSTTPPKAAAQGLLAFLKSLGSQVVLVGHNIIRFDGPRLISWMKKHGILSNFMETVHGFSDTLKLIGKGEPSKRQEVLARKFLGPEWEDILSKSHNARVDCQILEALLSKFEVDDSKILDNAVSLVQLSNASQQKAHKKEVRSTLNLLKGHISAAMIGKIAAANITFDMLLQQFNLSGAEGVKLFLGQSVGGKVKVTTNVKIVNKIIDFLQTCNKEN